MNYLIYLARFNSCIVQLLHENLSIKVRSYPVKLRARLFIASVTSDADNAIYGNK